MTNQLFSTGVQTFMQRQTELAVAETAALSAAAMLEPTLSKTLDQIAAKHCITVATVHPDKKIATRRTVKRTVMDYGQRRELETVYLDITVPFQGSERSFHIAPSQITILSNNAKLSNGNLIVTLLDDDNLGRELDEIIRHIENNLQRLEAELKPAQAQLRSSVEVEATRRLEILKAQQERDKKRGFRYVR